MNATDLEQRLEEVARDIELAYAFNTSVKRLKASFSRFRPDMGRELNVGVLTIGQVVDEVLWHSTYHPQFVTNIINGLGIDYDVSSLIAQLASYVKRQTDVNGQHELPIQLIADSEFLPKDVIATMDNLYGVTINRTYGILTSLQNYYNGD